MSNLTPPVCKSFRRWLEAQPGIGKHCLAPCTGQDLAALRAFAHLVEVYCYGDDRGRRAAIGAMRALIDGGMQSSVRPLAKRMIPHIMDWCHEKEIWDQIESPDRA